MNVLRIPVARGRDQAVITRDRMRVDIEAAFFVRVTNKPGAVAAAAATPGRRTLYAEHLADLLTGNFVGALRSVAAEKTPTVMTTKPRTSDVWAKSGPVRVYIVVS